MGGVHESKKLHVAMYPWFALGHFIPFLNLANKLAAKGHKISLFLPNKVSSQLAFRNRYPNHITFIPITVPTVDGLPVGTETMSDTRNVHLLLTAMDLTEPTIDLFLSELKPDIVLFDFTHWLPRVARRYKIKSILFFITHVCLLAYTNPSARSNTKMGFGEAPPGFPCPEFWLEPHESKKMAGVHNTCGMHGLTFKEMISVGIKEADAVCFKGCREMDMHYGEYFEKHYGKPVIWAGPGLPKPSFSGLDEKMDEWLNSFDKGSVVYCALGSESNTFEKVQFQELLLGLELTGLPFLAALKPPAGCDKIELAMPEGFAERTKDRGAVHDWVQQELILKHPSVGCFVTHCGASSFTESIVSDCQLVLLPLNVDHAIIARLMSTDLKVGIEVKRGKEDGFFTKEDVYEAIMKVVDEKSEVGVELRKNHAKWREIFLKEGFEESYTNSLVQAMQNLIK